MNIEDFHALTRQRIPTPSEFVEFVRSQGWAIGQKETGAFLRAPKSDPLALALARMMSREPYRTNVLALMSSPSPEPKAEEPHRGE